MTLIHDLHLDVMKLYLHANTNKKAKDFGKRSRLLLSMWPEVVFTYFTSKTVTLVFDPSRSSKVKSVPIESPLLLSKKFSLGSNLLSVTVFKILRIKGLWPWPLTSQGRPKWSPRTLYNLGWVQRRNSCRSWHISRQKVWPWFLTPPVINVKSDGANRKPVCSRDPTSYLSLFSRYFKSKGQIWRYFIGTFLYDQYDCVDSNLFRTLCRIINLYYFTNYS